MCLRTEKVFSIAFYIVIPRSTMKYLDSLVGWECWNPPDLVTAFAFFDGRCSWCSLTVVQLRRRSVPGRQATLLKRMVTGQACAIFHIVLSYCITYSSCVMSLPTDSAQMNLTGRQPGCRQFGQHQTSTVYVTVGFHLTCTYLNCDRAVDSVF